MFTAQQAEAVLQRALARGADFAELYLENSSYSSIRCRNERVENLSSSRQCGAGVRVFLGCETAYAYSSGWELEDLLRAADDAASALSPGGTILRPQPWKGSLPEMQVYDFPYAHISMEEKLELMRRTSRAGQAEDSKISQMQVFYLDEDKEVLVFNSEGLQNQDHRCYGRLLISAIATADDGRMMTAGERGGTTEDFRYFREQDWEEIAKTAARRAVRMLEAPECPAAVLPVVIDSGFGGVIFHEACGHSLESSSVAYGDSVFSGKLGQPIAAPCVSAMDDGTLAGAWGSLRMDDEGHPTQQNLLIENGILKSYLVDRLGSRMMGVEATGSARRENYRIAPTSRMNNTFILPGQDDPEAMICELAEGLYAKTLGGGSVNPLTGEFNFAVEEGYWIRNGQLLTPVRGATLIGKGSEVLMKIDRVSKNLALSDGMCGASSGSVPVCVGQPRLRVSELTIGGSGGAL